MPADRRRILLAVEPPILADALRVLLEQVDHDLVTVDLRSNPDPDHYEAAVVVYDLPTGASADVVVRLPDDAGNAGTGLVIDLRGTQEVRIEDFTDVIDLLAGRRYDT